MNFLANHNNNSFGINPLGKFYSALARALKINLAGVKDLHQEWVLLIVSSVIIIPILLSIFRLSKFANPDLATDHRQEIRCFLFREDFYRKD